MDVLSEKPLAPRVTEADRIVKSSETARVTLETAYHSDTACRRSEQEQQSKRESWE